MLSRNRFALGVGASPWPDDYEIVQLPWEGRGRRFDECIEIVRGLGDVQRPTLVMAPNKSLAAQLTSEFRELFPKNRVEYFVSYYDYYQPEAYMPTTDTYIEKDSSINDEIDRLRHSATSALLSRRDVVIVASV